MAIAFVAAWAGVQNSAPSPPQSLTTAAVDTTGADLIVATVTNDSSAGLAFSDNKGNSYSLAFGPTQNGTGDFVAIYYCKPTTVGAGHTLTGTATAASNFMTISAACYSGIAASTPLDKTASATGSGTALDSGNTATTAQADELIIGGGTVSGGSTVTWTAGSGFTLRSHVDAASVGGVSYVEDKIVAATGAYNAPITSSLSGTWLAAVTTFKGLVANGPTITAQPVNQTASVGGTATFNISATTSGGALSYQWKLNGSNVGTNSSSYTTGTLAAAYNGSAVTCGVTDSNGTTTTRTALLFIRDIVTGKGRGLMNGWTYDRESTGSTLIYGLLRKKLGPNIDTDQIGKTVWTDWFFPSSAPSGAMSGTASLTFGQTGALTGTGNMTASAALTFGQTGGLSGRGALTGATSLTFGQTGNAIAVGLMTGSTSLTFGQSGSLAGSGQMVGSTSLSFGQTGVLGGIGALTGSAPIVFQISGTLDVPGGSGEMQGSASLTFGSTATLTATAALSGSTSLTFGQAATIIGLANISGTTSLLFGQSGQLIGSGLMQGSTALIFDSQGQMVGTGVMQGTSAVVFGASGTLTVFGAASSMRSWIGRGKWAGSGTKTFIK